MINDNTDPRYNIVYRSKLSTLYHQKRVRFFDVCDKSINAVALFGSSTAFVGLAYSQWLIAIATGFIAFFSAIGLIFGFSEKARKHSELSKQYQLLLADIYKYGDKHTNEQIFQWNATLYEIQSDEPPTLNALATLCNNQLCIANGDTEHYVPFALYQRIKANFFDFDIRENIKKQGQINY